MSPRIEIDREKVEAFCKKWKIVELSLFGSVLRDDFRPDSDVDVLVVFAPDAEISLLDIIRAEDEFEEIVGRKIDLVQKCAVEKSRNQTRKNHILSHMERYYVAG